MTNYFSTNTVLKR